MWAISHLASPWRRFLKRLLDDLYALEKMLEDGLVETGNRRIGAEQELFLVDAGGRPQPAAMEVLRALDDPHFATELARFNLEINLDPLLFSGSALSDLERQLEEFLARLRTVAAASHADVVLAGILPSLRKSDMGLHNMTPLPRYAALDKATAAMRGEPMQYRIKGVDELSVIHDSVMLEACNASFQVHLQVSPHGFHRLYNAAQAFSAPVLAAAVNSPLLFGKRLWQETRIALFQQAVDYRHKDQALRGRLRAATPGIPPIMAVDLRHPVTPDDGFVMAPGYRNFDPVSAGQVVARDKKGPVISRRRSRMLLPLYQAQGSDGFFLVRKIHPFWLRLSALLRRSGLPGLVHWLPGVHRHPEWPETLVVNTRVARLLPLQVLHLLGFRKLRWQGHLLMVSRRRFDTRE